MVTSVYVPANNVPLTLTKAQSTQRRADTMSRKYLEVSTKYFCHLNVKVSLPWSFHQATSFILIFQKTHLYLVINSCIDFWFLHGTLFPGKETSYSMSIYGSNWFIFFFSPLHNFFPSAATYGLNQDEELENH